MPDSSSAGASPRSGNVLGNVVGTEGPRGDRLLLRGRPFGDRLEELVLEFAAACLEVRLRPGPQLDHVQRSLLRLAHHRLPRFGQDRAEHFQRSFSASSRAARQARFPEVLGRSTDPDQVGGVQRLWADLRGERPDRPPAADGVRPELQLPAAQAEALRTVSHPSWEAANQALPVLSPALGSA